jgi:uncharacterized protein
VRTLRAAGMAVTLADTEPYRDLYPWPAAPRLDGAEFARWQVLFQDAWQEIEQVQGGYAAAIAAGLTSLVPLAGAPGSQSVRASRHAPGAVAVARPADPGTLAMLLTCGFQQLKFAALVDLFDLFDPAGTRLFASPWAEGKQHLEDLFRDAYAHLACLQFWQARQRAIGDLPTGVSGRRFAQERAECLEATQTLAHSGSLTSVGTAFVERMHIQLASPNGPHGLHR